VVCGGGFLGLIFGCWPFVLRVFFFWVGVHLSFEVVFGALVFFVVEGVVVSSFFLFS